MIFSIPTPPSKPAEENSALPETPFNGIVIARNLSKMTPPGYSDRVYLKVSLVIMPTDGDSDSAPLVGHSYLVDRQFDAKDHIRVGHSVKIHTVQKSAGDTLVADKISFDLRQLVKDFRSSKPGGSATE